MDKNTNALLSKINIGNLTTAFIVAEAQSKSITEIRIRPDCDVKIRIDGALKNINNTFVDKEYIEKIFLSLCDYTVSAFEDQISEGYITISGGIRVGLGGKFYKNNNDINFSQILSLNIRLPQNKFFTVPQDLLQLKKGLLIIGKPHSGKTTLLKSLCRCFDNLNIVVCDERYELYNEKLALDYICGINKAIAIQNATRALSPDIIICDEIGDSEETQQMLSAVNSGVKFICTAHCDSIDDIYNKPNISKLITANVFDKIVKLNNLENKYVIEEIIDV